jgi:hypothetical protein
MDGSGNEMVIFLIALSNVWNYTILMPRINKKMVLAWIGLLCLAFALGTIFYLLWPMQTVLQQLPLVSGDFTLP